MTQTQFLILLLSIIPFANCVAIKLWAHSPRLINIGNKLAPFLFLVNLIGLYGNFRHDNSYLALIEATRGISLGFVVDQLAMGFLFLLDFFWIIFAFYSQRFWQLSEVKDNNDFRFFFALIIAFVNLIIISKNLLTILFFYNCLVLLCHFFAVKFFHKKEGRFSQIFTFFLYLESIFLFLAIVATYKFTGQIEFNSGEMALEKLDQARYILLLVLYVSGLFLSVLLPSYLLYRNINLDLMIVYSLFFLGYALSSLYIFIKLFNFVFGFKGFALLISKIGFGYIEWIFLPNIIAASYFLIASKGLKSSFFYLLFQQFTFTLFTIFAFIAFDPSKVYLSLFSFLLSITLIFLCLSNFVLYLSKATDKRLEGLFYNLKVTTVFLIFGVLNLIGIAPGVGLMEKFFLIKILFKKKLLLSGLIFIVNFASLALFAWKIFFPLFVKNKEGLSKEDVEITKNIDFDSNLILTALIVVVAIFLSLILFPFVINFFSI